MIMNLQVQKRARARMKPQHRYIYEKATWKMEIEGNAQKIAHDFEQSAYSETKQINNTNEKHNQKRESINPKPKTKMKSASLFGIKMLFMRVVFPSNNILCLLWTHTHTAHSDQECESVGERKIGRAIRISIPNSVKLTNRNAEIY